MSYPSMRFWQVEAVVKCIIRQALLLGAEREARVELTEAGLVMLPRTLLVQWEFVANAQYVRESLSMDKLQSNKSRGLGTLGSHILLLLMMLLAL